MKKNKTYLFNCMDIAEEIQILLGAQQVPSFMMNLYSPHQKEPVFCGHEKYYIFTLVTGKPEPVPFNPFEQKKHKGIVYNSDNVAVCNMFNVDNYTTQPTYPENGLLIIKAVIENLLLTTCAWSGVRYLDENTTLGVVENAVRDFYKYTCLPEATIEDITNSIALVVGDLERELARILMKKRWIMFFYKLDTDNGDIELEETIDYRIHQWEVEHGAKFRKKHPNTPL